MADTNVKQKIASKIRDSNNILVTVNANPSIDELSAALGVTLLINKLDKHATCVFSGEVPSAMEFLNPEKTFEGTVDSLRDFIIALDKEKADHLRYKVDGDVVKIFITPYRTVINQNDLDFSQGDYNVEFVLAIGVRSEADLDKALESHGRILHDAVVASVSLDNDTSVGSLHWYEEGVSSYSELLAGLGNELKTGKSLFDEQISTAFLTGIVAATDRFSNAKTTSDIMTLAAQLMSTGANQQLIATQLEEASEISPAERPEKTDSLRENENDATLKEGKSAKVHRDTPPESTQPEKQQQATKSRDGALVIEHEHEQLPRGDVDEVAAHVERQRQKEAAEEAEEELAARLAQGISDAKVQGKGHASPLLRELEQASRSLPPLQSSAPPILPLTPQPSPGTVTQTEPILGGTLNATTEQAAIDKRKQIEDDRNRTILSHDGTKYINDKPTYQSPINAVSQEAENRDKAEVQDIFATPPSLPETNLPSLDDIQPPAPVATPTLEEIDRQHRQHAEAVGAVHAAFEETPLPPSSAPVPSTPQPSMQDSGPLPPLPPLPPMPSFTSPTDLPLPPSVPMMPPPVTIPDRLEETLPPLPPAPASQQPVAADPGQFRIPNQ